MILTGRLGSRFGEVHNIYARTVREIFAVLRANFPDFEAVMVSSEFHVFAGRHALAVNDVDLPHFGSDIVIHAINSRCKKGWIPTIIGTALMYLGTVTGPFAPVFYTGGAMMLSYGMSQLFQPKLPTITSDTNTTKDSDVFTGGQNMAPMGAAVPLTLGKAWQGDVVVSVGITVSRG